MLPSPQSLLAPHPPPLKCPVPPFTASWFHTHLLPSRFVPQVRFPVEGSQDGPFMVRARSTLPLTVLSLLQAARGAWGAGRTGRVEGSWSSGKELYTLSPSLILVYMKLSNTEKNTQKSAVFPHPSIPPKGGLTPPPLSTGPIPYLQAGFLPEFPSPFPS